MNKFLLIALLMLLSVGTVQADEYRPAFLELRQSSDEVFEVLWKVPALGDRRLGLDVRFPADVDIVSPVRASMIGGAYIERYTIRSNGGLAGSEIVTEGLSTVSTEVLVRIERLDGTTIVARLLAANPSFVVGESLSRLEVARTYTVFGIEHILGGIDHLLFIACLVLIAGTGRRILITITGFTLAHSITLTLAALELVLLPIPPIEAVIALSIVFLAREIALQRRDTLTWRYPIAVSASFGLLHGFGFASALSEIGLPQTEIPAALLAFNVGVEIGQILFVGVIIATVWVITSIIGYLSFIGSANSRQLKEIKPLDWLRRIEKPLAYTVGGTTIIWTVERTMVFWS
jgi:hydrogenase/urease accessory protein HupE